MTSTKKADPHLRAALPTGATFGAWRQSGECDGRVPMTMRAGEVYEADTIGWITLGTLATVLWLSLGGSTFHRGEAVRFSSLSGTISDELAAARRAG
jgi:hypothetical protein